MNCGDCEYYGKPIIDGSNTKWHWCEYPDVSQYRIDLLRERGSIEWSDFTNEWNLPKRMCVSAAANAPEECFRAMFSEVV